MKQVVNAMPPFKRNTIKFEKKRATKKLRTGLTDACVLLFDRLEIFLCSLSFFPADSKPFHPADIFDSRKKILQSTIINFARDLLAQRRIRFCSQILWNQHLITRTYFLARLLTRILVGFSRKAKPGRDFE